MKHLMIAHRGDATNFPENTMEAFESAFDTGADGVELDMQEQDGELIVVHNYLYDRSKTYPKLTAVLEQFSQRGRLEIEVKSLDYGFLEPLQAALAPYAGADIELTTSVVDLIPRLRPAFRDFTIGVIFQDREFEPWMETEGDFVTTKITKAMERLEANTAHVPLRVANPVVVGALHELGFRAHVHLARAPLAQELEAYHRVLAMGADQSTFDDINLLSAIGER